MRYEALNCLHALVSLAHFKSVDWNPIQVYDFMVSSSDAVYCPYGFGYSNYSRIGSSPRLKFTNAPAAGQRGCAGTMLGGTGIAVSSTQHSSTGSNCLRQMARQPRAPKRNVLPKRRDSLQVWRPGRINRWTPPLIASFPAHFEPYRRAYVRPRFDGFVRFFEAAGLEINRCLRGHLPDAELVRWLNEHYAAQRISARQIA